jgi:hypothetical protein
MKWNDVPDFGSASARGAAHIASEDFVEFKNPLTKQMHRVKLFIVKVVPHEAGERPGEPRYIAIGFEVEKDDRSAPTFQLESTRSIRRVDESSNHAFRIHAGAVKYLVLLAAD